MTNSVARFELLKALYEACEGRRNVIVNVFELGKELGLSREDVYSHADWLAGEGLLKFETLGGGVSITHEGIKRVEGALSPSDQPPDHLSVNVIYVESMAHSQIQQATSNSILVSPNFQIEALQDLVTTIRSQIHELNLEEDQTSELEAYLSTIEAQIRSPSPKRGTISEALASVRRILEAAAGQAAASALIEMLTRLSW